MHVSRRVELFEVVSRSRRPRDPNRSPPQETSAGTSRLPVRAVRGGRWAWSTMRPWGSAVDREGLLATHRLPPLGCRLRNDPAAMTRCCRWWTFRHHLRLGLECRCETKMRSRSRKAGSQIRRPWSAPVADRKMLANADRMRYDPGCRSGSLAGLASAPLPNRDGRRTFP